MLPTLLLLPQALVEIFVAVLSGVSPGAKTPVSPGKLLTLRTVVARVRAAGVNFLFASFTPPAEDTKARELADSVSVCGRISFKLKRWDARDYAASRAGLLTHMQVAPFLHESSRQSSMLRSQWSPWNPEAQRHLWRCDWDWINFEVTICGWLKQTKSQLWLVLHFMTIFELKIIEIRIQKSFVC